jgi:polyisoprenoid-binding protein YceI
MKKMTTILVLTLMSAMVHPVLAGVEWELAKGPSQIGFKVKHLVFSTVEGHFRDFVGAVTIPQSTTLEGAQMSATIDVNSIYTGNKDRDRHLSGKDFFYTEQYPRIQFESKAVLRTHTPNEYRIIGDLTIRGITREIELIGTFSDEKLLNNGRVRVDLTATSTLNRFDFGLKWNEMLESSRAIVGEEVELALRLTLYKDSAELAKAE